MDQFPTYTLSKEELLKKINTNESGLTESEATKRLGEYGPNMLKPKDKISALSLYLGQFKNTLTLILLGSTFLILFIYFFGERDTSDLIEAGLIIAIILMTTILGFAQEFKAEKAIESLKRLMPYKTKVIRDGKEKEIDAKDLVPGDIVVLEEGTKVPADIQLIRVFGLTVNQASLTGESEPVLKISEPLPSKKQIDEQTNMVFSATSIASGRGIGIVIRTGDNTEIGKIAKDVSDTKESKTPIQQRLDGIGKNIGYIVLGISVIVFVFIVFFAKEFSALPLLQRIIHSFIAAIALAVAAIPEGLPAVVTISLALGTQRMLKKNVLVRKLNSVETLGSTDVICSDKTGTLTKGEMTVKEIYLHNKYLNVEGIGYETSEELDSTNKKDSSLAFKRLFEIGLLCNNASLGSNNHALGDPTEIALLVSAAKAKINTHFERVHEIPFSSGRKMMSVVLKNGTDYYVYTKGATEIILENCNYFIEEDKEIVLTDKEKKEFLLSNKEMSEKALRNLGFAYKKLSEGEYQKEMKDDKLFEKNLIFVGIQGMIDPPREEVRPLIEKLKASGIRVIMITGDHIDTALAISKEIGIEGDALTGEELDNLKDEEFINTVERISVYARANPGSKMRIVEALKKKGHIVAMTGDGVNDAPALKRADIGVAMGITGTDVAKEASDMVLLDDNFGTIVAAIEEGRGIYHNIKKFVNYLISCNIGEVLVVFFAVILFQKIPLTATMLLWINVVTDGLPAVALGLDPSEEGIMLHSPKKFQEQIITPRLWVDMFIYGTLMTIVTLGMFLFELGNGLPKAQGVTFTAIIMFELIMLYIIRSSYKTSFFSNLWLLLSVIGTIIVQIIIIYTPLISRLFEIEKIDLTQWGYIILGCVFLWTVFKSIKRLLDARKFMISF